MAHARFVQPFCQQLQHGGELAEQQDAVSALHSSRHQLHAGIQLGATAVPVVCHKARVAADLPQAHEHCEHRHFILRLCSAQLFPRVHHSGKVELALLLVQLDTVEILGLGGQLFEHLGLHAPQDERPGELVQTAQCVFVVLLHDRLFKPGAEGLVGRQIPRHQEGEDAPQFAQAVLHRGAGKGKPHFAVHPAHRLVLLGSVVLDGLRFVQNAGVELLPAVKLLVPAHQVIAGHHKVGFRPLLCQLCPVNSVAVHSHAGKLRRELLAFLLPVEHQRCRADDETGQALAAFLHGQQVAEHLHGLAKAHIVGQNATHAVAVQRAQPAVAIPLVLAQHIVQAFRRSILAVLHGVKAAADAAERIVAVETQAVLARERPVETGCTVERQLGVAALELGPGKFQCIVQFVQPFQTVIQPQQTAVPQAVVALFLVQGAQQVFQLCHRELAGIHFQIQHTAVHRNAHRDARRRGLQAAEGIRQVYFTLGQQGRHALLQHAVDLVLVSGAVHFLSAAHTGLQIRGQQPLCPALGAHIPQKPCRRRHERRDLILPVQKLRVCFDAEAVRCVQIELHHRFQRDLVQQQTFRVHDVQLAAQLRQHIAAKGRGICAGKEQAFAAQRLQCGQDAGAPGPLQPPERILAEQVIIVKALYAGKGRAALHLHTAAAALHGHGNDGQTFPQLVPAQKTGMLVQLHKVIKDLAGQDHASRRALFGPAVHPHGGFVHALPCVHLTAQQLQKRTGLFIKGIPPVHKSQCLAVADAFAHLDGFHQVRDAFHHILPPAVRDAQPQPWLCAGHEGQLRFQMGKAGALGGLVHAKVFKGCFLVGIQQPAGLVIRHRRFAVPLFAKQHFQPGGIAVPPGRFRSKARRAAHNAGNSIRLCRRCRGILFGIVQQQCADMLAVGALAVLVIRAAAGRTDKAAVLPQPCLRIVIAAAAALYHGRNMPHAIGVHGAGALLDALAVFLSPLKNVIAQKRADLVCIHGCFLPAWL